MLFFKEKKEDIETRDTSSSEKELKEFAFKLREPLNSVCGIAEVLTKWIREDYDKQQILNYMDLLKAATDDLQNSLNSYISDTNETISTSKESDSNNEDYSILKNLRIMVVEDNETNSMIMCELLETYGAIVTHCENGRKAIEKFTESISGTYDIILMDINMPEMDGYEATDRIRNSNNPQAKTIPIIATTAETSSENVGLALKAGMNAHVSKPYSLGKIISAIKATL